MGAVTPLYRRLLLRAICALPVSVLLALGLGVSTAGAVLVPSMTSPQWSVMPMLVAGGSGSGVQGQILDHGGDPLGATHIYEIYWDPTSPPNDWPINYPQSTKLLTAQFLNDAANDSHTLDNPFSLDTQYDTAGGNEAGNTAGTAPGYEMQFEGAYTDQIDQYPTQGQPGDCTDPNTTSYKTNVCLTDAQIRAELQSYIAQYALPTGPGNVYLVMTPPDVTTCLDATSTECSDVTNRTQTSPTQAQTVQSGGVTGYCGYHSVIGSGASEVLYGQVPWPYPNIPNADTLGPNTAVNTAVPYTKVCQTDGATPVSLPNGIQPQPALTNGGGVEVDFGDVLINVITHELNGIITDPNFNGFYDGSGLEAPDKCEAVGQPELGGDPAAWFVWAGLTPGPVTLPYIGSDNLVYNTYNVTFSDGDVYYLHSEFNAAQNLLPTGYGGQCDPSAQLTPRFAAPTQVDPNQLVGFDPSPTIATMTIRTYEWNFGDGSTPAVVTCPVPSIPQCDPSVFHAFTTPGDYTVTLSVTDGGFNNASTTQTIDVLGARPGGGGSGSGSGSSSSSTSTSSTAAATSSAAPASSGTTAVTSTATSTTAAATPAAVPPSAPIVPPKVNQAITASSVSKALKSGLVVHYSVTEKVVGHFQVLLDARTAKQLGIKSPVVKGVKVDGLSNPIEIGTALLETTKPGSSGIAITFSKAAAAKLKHARTLTLTVRLVAENIAGQQVVVTTTIKLH